MKKTVCALIQKDDLYLVVSKKNNKNVFGLPGGKLEENEHFEAVLKREVFEETGLNIFNPRLIFMDVCKGEEDFESYVFVCDFDGEIHTTESGVVKWVDEQTLKTGVFADYNKKLFEYIVNKKLNDEIIQQVAKKYNLIVYDGFDDLEKFYDIYEHINYSCCAGNEIWIGIYNDNELRTASFFHEVGHILNGGKSFNSRYMIEKAAWIIGFHVASQFGIDLNTSNVRRFARLGILSHCDSERRDHLCFVQDDKSRLRRIWITIKENVKYKIICMLVKATFY